MASSYFIKERVSVCIAEQKAGMTGIVLEEKGSARGVRYSSTFILLLPSSLITTDTSRYHFLRNIFLMIMN